MRILTILFLGIALLIIALEAWAVYFPFSFACHCPQGAVCIPCVSFQVGEIFPLWLPLVSMAVWIISLIYLMRKKFSLSFILSLGLILISFLNFTFYTILF
jgi:hypothetical protein